MKVRPLEKSDERWLWEYRNHPDVRHGMLDPAEIQWEIHRRWFEASLENKSKLFLVGESKTGPVGLVYFDDVRAASTTWGFYVGAPFQGKGHGIPMGELALAFLFEHSSVATVIGEVLEENARSEDYHLKLGFQKTARTRSASRLGQEVTLLQFELSREDWAKREQA